MKNAFVVCILAFIALGMGRELAVAKQLSPRKNGEWLDLQSRGIVFGTIAETSDASKAKVTYFIRRKDGKGETQTLVSKKGLFAFNLKPGEYEIYDWTVSGSKGSASQDRFTFEVRAGFLTYIGRIVTNMERVDGEKGRKAFQNRPYLLDEKVYDAGLFAQVYPVLAKLDVILAARQGFEWR